MCLLLWTVKGLTPFRVGWVEMGVNSITIFSEDGHGVTRVSHYRPYEKLISMPRKFCSAAGGIGRELSITSCCRITKQGIQLDIVTN
ncbi:hypothetical protein AVEN_63087-1 [Araneus ventricosus]|uniref:Uncharacterized protein n=1 Tax=Araneus ventricosus TaxID=182803 RepID=A0A4Y2WZD3_ARAVE|nr:hypothetical protein AVEN_63087-1 [Araneus ventricosus]